MNIIDLSFWLVFALLWLIAYALIKVDNYITSKIDAFFEDRPSEDKNKKRGCG